MSDHFMNTKKLAALTTSSACHLLSEDNIPNIQSELSLMFKAIPSSLFTTHKAEEFSISLSAFLHDKHVDNNEIMPQSTLH